MNKFIHIKTGKYLPLPGEEEEMVNEGMYGKALSTFLQEELKKLNYDAPFVCCEDWGWWVELKGFPFVFGVCIRSWPIKEPEMEYVVSDGAVSPKIWSWKKFKFIDTASAAEKLFQDLERILENDPDIEVIQVTDEYPFEDLPGADDSGD